MLIKLGAEVNGDSTRHKVLCFTIGGIVVVSVSLCFGVVAFWWSPFPCVFLEAASHPVWPFKDLKHRRGGVRAPAGSNA